MPEMKTKPNQTTYCQENAWVIYCITENLYHKNLGEKVRVLNL